MFTDSLLLEEFSYSKETEILLQIIHKYRDNRKALK